MRETPPVPAASDPGMLACSPSRDAPRRRSVIEGAQAHASQARNQSTPPSNTQNNPLGEFRDRLKRRSHPLHVSAGHRQRGRGAYRSPRAPAHPKELVADRPLTRPRNQNPSNYLLSQRCRGAGREVGLLLQLHNGYECPDCSHMTWHAQRAIVLCLGERYPQSVSPNLRNLFRSARTAHEGVTTKRCNGKTVTILDARAAPSGAVSVVLAWRNF